MPTPPRCWRLSAPCPSPNTASPSFTRRLTGRRCGRLPVLAQDDATTTLTTVARFTEDGKIEGDSATEATGTVRRQPAQRVRRIEWHAGSTPGLRGCFTAWARTAPGRSSRRPADLSAPTITASAISMSTGTSISLAAISSGCRLGCGCWSGRATCCWAGWNSEGCRNSEPTPCYAGRQVEVLTLTLPPDRHVQRLPAGRTIATRGVRFQLALVVRRPDRDCAAPTGLAHRPAIVLRPASRRRRTGSCRTPPRLWRSRHPGRTISGAGWSSGRSGPLASRAFPR